MFEFINAKEDTLDIQDGTVTYLSFGSGTKPLVMIPGLRLSGISGGAKAVAWYYRVFLKEYRVYMFDKKDPVTDPCTIHDLAADVAAAMEKLGLKAAYVFGASQGGMIAQDLAIHHPELVSKLVLGVTLSRNNETVQQVVQHWIELADTEGLSAVAEDYIQKGYSEAYLKKYKAFLPLLIKTQKLMPKERFITLAKACLTCDTYEQLERIQCPVLVLGGGKDQIVTGAASLEIAEKLHCAYHIYDDLSHEAYNEAKDFNQRIYDFLRG